MIAEFVREHELADESGISEWIERNDGAEQRGKRTIDDVPQTLGELLKNHYRTDRALHFLVDGYVLNAVKLEAQLVRIQSIKHAQALRREVEKFVQASVDQALAAHGDSIRIDSQARLLEAVSGNVRVMPSPRTKEKARDMLPSKLSIRSEKLKSLIISRPELLARRVAKDALSAQSRLFSEIARATDLGIKVEVKTLAVRGSTDNRLYENGHMLRILGVDSDASPGWQADYFLPKHLS